MRDFQKPGRSTVHALNGMCATSHPAAAQVAVDVLRRGGNAVDAAIAASAVLAVIEPAMTGIGGDCFVLYAPKGEDRIIGLNGSGRAPRAADTGWFLDRGITAIHEDSVHSVTIPGCIDAWARLVADHGTMGLDTLLQPAIQYAREGFVVAPKVAVDWEDATARLAANAGSRQHFMTGGSAPRAGDVFRMPALAKALEAVARNGRAGFYEGPVADAMVRALKAAGGLHTLEDFAATACDYVQPIRTAYRGHDVVELPPNGQGLTALIMLNILEGFDLGGLDPAGAERLHLQAEATRLAYAERDKHIADPHHHDVPVTGLLSKAFAAERRSLIQPERAMTSVAAFEGPINTDTIYLTVVDRDLNAISFINSVYHSFGSCITCPETGIAFQNRGAGFRVEPGHPNTIAGGKRPMHTIIPAMIAKGGKVTASYGVMGGAYQCVGHAHVAGNLIDHGMDIQEAIDAPRAFHVDGTLELETTIPEGVAEALAAKGHRTTRRAKPLGGGQGILIDHATGVLTGGSDPRKDGAAIGW